MFLKDQRNLWGREGACGQDWGESLLFALTCSLTILSALMEEPQSSLLSQQAKHANYSIAVQKIPVTLLAFWHKSISFDYTSKAILKAGILLDHLAKLSPVFHKTFSSAQKISQAANEEVFITQMPEAGPNLNEL